MPRRKIFIDATGIVNTPTGLGKYSFYLLKALLKIKEYNFTVLVQNSLSREHPLFSLEKENVYFNTIKAPVIGPRRDLILFYIRNLINQHDLYHCLSSYFPAFGIRTSSIVTIHDLKYLFFPEFFRSGFKAVYYKWIITRGIHKATGIIAVSEATKKDIVLFGGSSDKIRVIYEAPTISNSTNQDLPPGLKGKRYFLFVGENRPHKNVKRLIEAFLRVSKQLGDSVPYLVLVGPKYAVFKSETRCDKIIFFGTASENTLCALYKNALALVYPSLYEGFGLPLLEAMSLQVPVITSNISSMPEVAGEAALYVDPRDVEQMASALLLMIKDEKKRKELIKKGTHRVRDFSWKRAADQVGGFYEQIISRA